MRVLLAILVTTVSMSAVAQPVDVDLTPERTAYEAKLKPRRLGLGLLAGTVALGGVSAFGFSRASATRKELLAQRVPVDTAQRQQLVSQGQQSSSLGLSAAILGIAAGLGSAYFLSVSF